MTRFAARAVLALAVLAAALPGSAQQARGVIKGTVKDSTGGVLPGATVTINSPQYIQKDLSQTTNARGEYRFPLLDPGTYTVKVEMMGFEPKTAKGIELHAGDTLDVPMTLEIAGTSATVEVESTPLIDKESTQIGSTFTKELLTNIPSGRSLGAIVNFTPGANDGAIKGSTVRGNALQLDGVNITDPTVGTQFVNFSFDNIEEVQVETVGLKAEYGNSSGGIVNTVTKSGGNSFSGEGNIYYQNDGLTATNGEKYLERFPNLTPNEVQKRIDTTGLVGGPIVKDKIWFYGSYGYFDEDTNVVGFVDESGNPIPANRNQNLGYAKVTWQLTPKNKLVGSYNYDSLDRTYRGGGSLVPIESTRNQQGNAHTPNFEFTSLFSSSTYLTVRGAFVDQYFDLIPQNDLPGHINLDTGRTEVSDGRFDLNKRKRKTVTGSLSHYRDDWGGTHDFKFGFEYENSDEWRDFTASQGLLYYDTGTVVSTPTYVYTIQDPAEKAAQNRTSFYAQDSWTIQNRLTVNAGVRMDHTRAFFPEQQGAAGQTFEETEAFTTTEFSPRIGLSFDITGDGKSAVRASYARIIDASITQYFSSINQNAISGQLRIVCDGPLGADYCSAGQRFSDPIGEFGASNTTIDPDFNLPIVDEWSVGAEREIMDNVTFTVNYTEKKEKKLPETVNTRNFIPYTGWIPGDTLVDSDGNVIETFAGYPLTVYHPDPEDSDAFVIANPEQSKREYRGLEFSVNKRMSNHWQLLGSFVFSRSAGLVGTDFGGSTSISGLFDSPNSLINGYGNLNLHRPYQLKLQGTYEGPWGINFGSYYRYSSGTPFTRTARVTGRLVGFRPNGSPIIEPVFGGAVTINAERLGNHRLDGQHEMDFRIEKEFRIGPGRVDLIVDMLNLFNIDTVTAVRSRTSSPTQHFGDPTAFKGPREIRIASRYVF